MNRRRRGGGRGFLMAATLGATLVYLFDPQQGFQRRAAVSAWWRSLTRPRPMAPTEKPSPTPASLAEKRPSDMVESADDAQSDEEAVAGLTDLVSEPATATHDAEAPAKTEHAPAASTRSATRKQGAKNRPKAEGKPGSERRTTPRKGNGSSGTRHSQP